MASLKTLTVAAVLVVGATSFAVAQNGPATGGEPPVAGGAAASNPSAGSTHNGMAPSKTMHKKSMKKKESKPQ